MCSSGKEMKYIHFTFVYIVRKKIKFYLNFFFFLKNKLNEMVFRNFFLHLKVYLQSVRVLLCSHLKEKQYITM